MRLLLLVAGVGFFMSGAVPARAHVPGSFNYLEAIACPSASRCTATGRYVAYTFSPLGAVASPPLIIGSAIALYVACPSTAQCTIAGGANAVTFDPAAPDATTTTWIGGYASGVSCPSTSQCTVIGAQQETTFDPANAGARTTSTVGTSDGGDLALIACPSTRQCTAIANGRRQITFDPNSPTPAIADTIDAADDISGLDCPSIRQCTAVDQDGHEITFDPTVAGSATAAAIDDQTGAYGRQLYAVACPVLHQCTAMGVAGQEITFDPAQPGAAQTHVIDALPTAIACPSPHQCTSVDLIGREVTFDPTAPGATTSETIDTIGIGFDARMSSATVHGKRASVVVSCNDYVSLACTETLQLSAVEELRRGRVIRVLAAGAKTRPRLLKRTVILASTTVHLAAGQSTPVDLSLNAIGRRLLSTAQRLTATLTLISHETPSYSVALASQRVRLTTPRPHRHRAR